MDIPQKIVFIMLVLILFSQTGCTTHTKSITESINEDDVRRVIKEELAQLELKLAQQAQVLPPEEINSYQTQVPGDGDTERNSYDPLSLNQELEMLEVSSNISPTELAKNLLGDTNNYEIGYCFSSAQVSMYPINELNTDEMNSTLTVIYTHIGFCDGSVAGIEKRFDFEKIEQEQWQVNWVGQRYACRRGSGSWTTPGTLCP